MPGNNASAIVREDGGAWVAAWEFFELRSAFQPIFAADDSRLAPIGCEMLLRARTGNDNVPPLSFFASLPTAARVPVEKISHRLHIQNAAAFLPPDADIFINIDPSICMDRSRVEEVVRGLKNGLSGVDIEPERVVCEITEKKANCPEALASLAAQLRAGGFRIAIDDYGVEHSDMARIRDVRPDVVKFDAAWISHLMKSPSGVELLREMVSAFEREGIRTVFEGIEDHWQIEVAQRAGVSMLQGFALARPTSATEVATFFAGHDGEQAYISQRFNKQNKTGRRCR